MDNTNKDKKQPMTDEERLALCEKLDKELEEFIDKLPKKRYEDGWPEDKWQEEIEKHPFFMKKPPEPGDDVHPLYEGLQKLKYDPDENTPEDLATSYKEDGNFNFKHKNYRLAILSYTEGIKTKCNNPEIEATLYNNRAAANYFLKNYRSCLRDCEMALKYKPSYDKVLIRAANAYYLTQQYAKSIENCDLILDKDANNKEMQALRQKCINESKAKERDLRKKKILLKKQQNEESSLLNEIVSRNLQFDFGKDKITLEKLQPHIPQLSECRVFLNGDCKLVWPVTFVYPEYQIMDFIQEFIESDMLIDQIRNVFEMLPEWDTEKKYKANEINVYFENRYGKIVSVDTNDVLGTILQHKEFVIKGGTPSFILLPRNSEAEISFLKKYNYTN